MEPIAAAARPPSPLHGLLGLVPIMAAILVVLVLSLAMFELGRELSRHLAIKQIALTTLVSGLALNLTRACRCSWLRR